MTDKERKLENYREKQRGRIRSGGIRRFLADGNVSDQQAFGGARG